MRQRSVRRRRGGVKHYKQSFKGLLSAQHANSHFIDSLLGGGGLVVLDVEVLHEVGVLAGSNKSQVLTQILLLEVLL